jgi:tRNA nucleotidyltransferase (CCA-adding enzyme)
VLFRSDTSKAVTLEQDLSRRDLTVNAIAQKIDGNGSYVDPYGGIEDIKKKTLRHVSDAFSEDPVRILRTARFASRFSNFGFTIDDKTLQLIKQMVVSGEVDALTPERVFKEIALSMDTESPSVFFEVLIESGAYERLFPMLELSNNSDFKLLNQLIEEPEVAFALWLYNQNPNNIEALCDHLKCPKDFQQIAELVSEWHHFAMNFLSFSPQEVLNFYLKNDGLRRHRRFQIILTVFDCLDINTKPIIELLDLLKSIQISKLANINIAEEIVQERLSIITRFLDPTQ